MATKNCYQCQGRGFVGCGPRPERCQCQAIPDLPPAFRTFSFDKVATPALEAERRLRAV